MLGKYTSPIGWYGEKGIPEPKKIHVSDDSHPGSPGFFRIPTWYQCTKAEQKYLEVSKLCQPPKWTSKKKMFLGGGIVFQFYSGKAFPIFETFTKKNMGQIEKCPDVFVRRFLIFSFSKPEILVSNIQNSPWKSLVQWRFHRMALMKLIQTWRFILLGKIGSFRFPVNLVISVDLFRI